MKLNKLTFTAMAVFALVVQPVYAVIASQSAYAAGEISVTPANMQGWSAVTTTGGQVEMVHVAGAPLGTGAAKLTTTSDNNSRARLTTSAFSGTPLANVTQASYSSFVQSAPILEGSVSYSIMIDVDGSLATTTDRVSLNHEPYWQNGMGDPAPVVQGAWQNWDVANGKFWARNAALGFMSDAGGPPLYTLADALAIAPNAVVTDVSVYIGSYNPSYTTFVDNVSFNGQAYDFDPAPYIPTAPPVRPILPGEVIYDSVPLTLPSNSPSLGYEATSTSAFGDKITFAGSGRELDKVAVNLSSWACQQGQWNLGNCVSAPGATFAHPVTLNIYEAAEDGTVGSLIATRTQTFEIPYRPTADPTCGSATQWRDTSGGCFNGINHVVVFDAAGVTVPNTVIYSVAYNTQNYGEAPVGVSGPYSSLNFALSPTVNVGTNNDTDEVFWDTTYPGYTAGLKADSGWSANGSPAVIFTAKTTPVIDDDTDEESEENSANSTDTTTTESETVSLGSNGAASTPEYDYSNIAVATESDKENETVLGTAENEVGASSAQDTKDQKQWSLANVLLAVVASVTAIVTLAGVRGSEGRAKWLRILTIIPAVGAIVTVLAVEDFTASMGLINGWTLLFMVLVIAQAVLRANVQPADK